MTLKVPSNPTQSDPHHHEGTQLSGIKEKEATPESHHDIPKRNRGEDAQGAGDKGCPVNRSNKGPQDHFFLSRGAEHPTTMPCPLVWASSCTPHQQSCGSLLCCWQPYRLLHSLWAVLKALQYPKHHLRSATATFEVSAPTRSRDPSTFPF